MNSPVLTHFPPKLPLEPTFKLLHSSVQCLEEIVELIKTAQKSIDIETFYVLPDTIGRHILDLLIQKAKDGIKVRLLVDGMGSFSLTQSLFVQEFEKAGAHLRTFNSFLPFSKTKKSIWYFRNHRRTMLVDGQKLFCGSVCIGEPTNHWIETGIIIENSMAVDQALTAFDKTWTKSQHSTFRIGSSKMLSIDSFSYLTQAPLQGERYIYRKLIQYIRAAKQEVILVAPYIVPDRRFMRALRRAKKRKVTIYIIGPKKSDSRIVDIARDTFIQRFLNRGISLHLIDQMIHSKVAIIDRQAAFIGTMNLDNVSLRYNYECAIFTDNKTCIEELRASFVPFLENPDFIVTKEKWAKRSWFAQTLEILVWPIRKLL